MNNKLAQISLAINGVLAIAVGILFWLHFTSTPTATTAAAPSTDTSAVVPELPEIRSVNGPIAYIDIEKVLKGYNFVIDREKQLSDELAKDEKRIRDMRTKFESEYRAAEANAATMSRTELQLKQEKLQQMDADLQRAMAEYDSKNMSMSEKFRKEWLAKIDDFLKGLSKQKQYSYVITYVRGDYSAIVYANDSLDVTDEVLKGLNASYAKGK